MSRSIAATAFVACASLVAGPSRAQGLETPPGKWWKVPAVVEALKLTAAQQDKLEEVFLKNRKTFVDLKSDVQKRAFDLEDALRAKGDDPKKAMAASDALEEAKARLAKAWTAMVLEMKGVLSDEQWETLLEKRDEWKERRREQRHPLMDRPLGRRPGAGARPPRAPAE